MITDITVRTVVWSGQNVVKRISNITHYREDWYCTMIISGQYDAIATAEGVKEYYRANVLEWYTSHT